MDTDKVDRYLESLRYRRYTTGMIHLGGGPQWLEDLRDCIKIIEKLNEFKKHCKESHSLPDICCPD